VIYHLTTQDAWAPALSSGLYTADTLATEGFIHCSDATQVPWVANTRFTGRTDLLLLVIDPAQLKAEVRYENLEGGEPRFPHVYGPISTGAVLRVSPYVPGADGRFPSLTR
jgi:uncharacterized protein (DUF952 family)